MHTCGGQRCAPNELVRSTPLYMLLRVPCPCVCSKIKDHRPVASGGMVVHPGLLPTQRLICIFDRLSLQQEHDLPRASSSPPAECMTAYLRLSLLKGQRPSRRSFGKGINHPTPLSS